MARRNPKTVPEGASGRRFSAGLSTANGSQPASKHRAHARAGLCPGRQAGARLPPAGGAWRPNGLCLCRCRCLPEPRLRFWLKTSHALPDPLMLRAAAFAYLSDWWLNDVSVGGHLQALGPEQGLSVASLNHAIWWHRPFRADEWLHFDCRSPASGAGRGLTVVHGSRPQRPTRGERHAGMPDGPARRLTIACVRRGGGERCDGVLGSVHVIRRRRYGHLLLLYFSPRNTPPQRS